MITFPCNEATHFYIGGRCTKCKAKMPDTGMRTPHGVPMAPRGARLWTYIQQERRINLTSFSTDSCVKAVFPQLQDAHAEAEQRAKAHPDDWKARQLMDDVGMLLRRVPEARTDSNAAVKAKAAAHEAAGVSARDLEFE